MVQNVDILRTHPAKGGRPGPDRFNQVVYSRGFLYLAGQICEDTTAEGMDTYYGQTKQVLSQIKSLLNHSGSCMERILQVNALQLLKCSAMHQGPAPCVSARSGCFGPYTMYIQWPDDAGLALDCRPTTGLMLPAWNVYWR